MKKLSKINILPTQRPEVLFDGKIVKSDLEYYLTAEAGQEIGSAINDLVEAVEELQRYEVDRWKRGEAAMGNMKLSIDSLPRYTIAELREKYTEMIAAKGGNSRSSFETGAFLSWLEEQQANKEG